MAVTKAAFQSSRVPFRDADGQALVLHVEQIFTGFCKNAGTIWPAPHRQNEKGCTDKDNPLAETPMRAVRKVKPEDLTIVEPMK